MTLKDDGHPKIDYTWTDRASTKACATATRAAMEIQLAGGARQACSTHPVYATHRAGSSIASSTRASYEPCERAASSSRT